MADTDAVGAGSSHDVVKDNHARQVPVSLEFTLTDALVHSDEYHTGTGMESGLTTPKAKVRGR
ncbi:hypothetical protein [Nocardia terpenica]|uniref:Uncharacterized protein n=1 Tax=Nocardia terpenica TaxID=455432 RepID=A0A6G9ZEH9_9NOCA|nr:hypothetical protein [Nocardia terpenica]QIS23403.1 hypothetical protein F6W96_38810 [Nocardia terpenica]